MAFVLAALVEHENITAEELVGRRRSLALEERTSLGSARGVEEGMAAVSGARVETSLWCDDGRMPHIELARWAEKG